MENTVPFFAANLYFLILVLLRMERMCLYTVYQEKMTIKEDNFESAGVAKSNRKPGERGRGLLIFHSEIWILMGGTQLSYMSEEIRHQQRTHL
jgi:hypothetical protein